MEPIGAVALSLPLGTRAVAGKEVVSALVKAAAAIAALRPENAVAPEHAAKASEAVASGDRDEARRHLIGSAPPPAAMLH